MFSHKHLLPAFLRYNACLFKKQALYQTLLLLKARQKLHTNMHNSKVKQSQNTSHLRQP